MKTWSQWHGRKSWFKMWFPKKSPNKMSFAGIACKFCDRSCMMDASAWLNFWNRKSEDKTLAMKTQNEIGQTQNFVGPGVLKIIGLRAHFQNRPKSKYNIRKSNSYTIFRFWSIFKSAQIHWFFLCKMNVQKTSFPNFILSLHGQCFVLRFSVFKIW